ncbi:alpha/beta hydrolase [Cohnella fermenti]|uniref:Alpha/beta hydrolase n=1 Tax=Cohnella fermenti TaxID=2565925 RepID=A0A4S4BKS0_9BACL|nr:alpha/beta hydrolase [Cohnella fermenti]THF75336.1 alpha/beta hydrolase [Cohnella fermenti]
MNVWIGSVALAVLLGVCSISLTVVWKLMHPARKPVQLSPGEEGMAYESIAFRSRDRQVELKGWFLPAAGAPKMTIIFAHGYRGNRLQKNATALGLAKEFVQRDFNVVLFDFRNCGDSGGHITTIGLDEQQDILGAIDWCKARGEEPIGLIGFSMGAVASILAAAKSAEVSGVVADSPFGDLTRYLLNNLSVWSKLPKYPFSPLMVLAIRFVMRKNPRLVKPMASIQQIYPRPVLFIHGDQDDAIPCTDSEMMSKRFADAFSYWQVPGAKHTGSYKLYPQEYARRVVHFFDGLAGGR